MKAVGYLGVFLMLALVSWKMPFSFEKAQEPAVGLSKRRVFDHSRGSENLREALQALKGISDPTVRIREAIALATSIPEEDLEKLCTSGMVEMLDEPLKTLFRGIIFERWLEHDPEGMMDWSMMSWKNPSGSDDEINFYLAKWAEAAGDEAVEYIEGLGIAAYAKNYYLRGIFRELADLNPRQAMSLAKNHYLRNRDPFRIWEGDEVAFSMARHDLQMFLDIRKGWSDQLQSETASAVAAVLLLEDFENGVAFVEAEGRGVSVLKEAFYLNQSGVLFYDALDYAKNLPAETASGIVYAALSNLSKGSSVDLLELDYQSLGIEANLYEYTVSELVDYSDVLVQPMDYGRFLTILNGSAHGEMIRERMLAKQIGYWPFWDEEGLQSWLGGLSDETLVAGVAGIMVGRELSASPRKFQSPNEYLLEVAAGKVRGDLIRVPGVRRNFAMPGKHFSNSRKGRGNVYLNSFVILPFFILHLTSFVCW